MVLSGQWLGDVRACPQGLGSGLALSGQKPEDAGQNHKLGLGLGPEVKVEVGRHM